MRVGRREEASLDLLPEDTISLSYWLSRRLPISDQEKLSLLSIHCPTQRLIQALHILQVPLPSLPPSFSSSIFFLAALPACPQGRSSVYIIHLSSFIILLSVDRVWMTCFVSVESLLQRRPTYSGIYIYIIYLCMQKVQWLYEYCPSKLYTDLNPTKTQIYRLPHLNLYLEILQ